MLLASLNGPMHDLSDYYLFSVHMVQHLLLTLLFPPLLLLGMPGWLLQPAGRPAGSAAGGAGPDASGRGGRCSSRVTIAVWHLAPYYDLMMRNHDVHIATHLMFMVTATLMWWPVMSPSPSCRGCATGSACSTCFWSAFRCSSSPR